MTTRQDMRRELRDLAKLAGSMPKEPPPSAADRPSSVSAISVRPVVVSTAPVESTRRPVTTRAGTPGHGRGCGLAALVLAVAGGVTAGRIVGQHTAASRAPGAAAAFASPVAPVVAPTPVVAAAAPPVAPAAVAPADAPPADAPAALPPAAPVTVPVATPPKAAVVAGAHRTPARPVLKAPAAKAAPASDPLEEAIRRAVNDH